MRKKTDEQFKQEVYDLVGDEYTFLDSYKGSQTKIRVKHNKCGNTYKVRPNDFLNGNRCPHCSGLIKKTDEQFKQEVYDLVGNDYTFLDHYVNDKTKIRVKHNKCGNIYEVKPNSFLNGNRCPHCINRVRKTNEEFKQEVYNLVGDEYTFLDHYVNSRTKLRAKHNKCGHTYEVTPNSFLRGSRCPYCYGHIKKTDEQFKQEVYDLVGDEYTFLDPYVNNHAKLRVKHNECGNIYEVMPSDFLSGVRCPFCFGTPKKTDNQFKQKVYDLVENEYTFLEHYRGALTKISVKHNKCGNTYKVTPANFISNNSRCPYCNSPKGELMIDKILKSLDINYESQKMFDDLKDKSYLSYDFYIPDQNILIEYQGEQHYQPVDHFGGETTFKRQQYHDQMKRVYAKEQGYKLIAVPYTVDTFSKIKKYLIRSGLTS